MVEEGTKLEKKERIWNWDDELEEEGNLKEISN
jgi:hypothetical protein